MRRMNISWTVVVLCLLVALPAGAQSSRQGWRIGADTQVSVRGHQDSLPSTGLVIDSFIAAQWGDRTQIIARPVSRGRVDGGWSHDLYQARIRYQPPTRLPLRIEAGYALPILGLGAQRSRPLERDTGSFHPQYLTPLPSFETGLPAVYSVTPSYPLTAIASLGASHWDLRLGAADGSPARRRGVIGHNDAPRAPQLVVGGGVTPMTGLRIGMTIVRGDYVRATEGFHPTAGSRLPSGSSPDADGAAPYAGATFSATADHPRIGTASPPHEPETFSANGRDRRATISGVELEYEFGHTSVMAEWVRDVFETTTGRAIASSGFVRVTHALSPRWRIAGRYDLATPPDQSRLLSPGLNSLRLVEGLVAYRATRDIVVRGFFQAGRSFRGQDWAREAGVALALSHQWW